MVCVVTVTISVPVELKQKMDEMSVINWSAVAREAFEEKIRDLELIKSFKSDSTFTEKDAIRLGRKVNAAMAKHFKLIR